MAAWRCVTTRWSRPGQLRLAWPAAERSRSVGFRRQEPGRSQGRGAEWPVSCPGRPATLGEADPVHFRALRPTHGLALRKRRRSGAGACVGWGWGLALRSSFGSDPATSPKGWDEKMLKQPASAWFVTAFPLLAVAVVFWSGLGPAPIVEARADRNSTNQLRPTWLWGFNSPARTYRGQRSR
jgi:hypothetical protein